MDLENADKTDLKTPKAALKSKSGIDRDPLIASRQFNDLAQGAQEKAVDFKADLKQLFRQAFPEEDTESIVLGKDF